MAKYSEEQIERFNEYNQIFRKNQKNLSFRTWKKKEHRSEKERIEFLKRAFYWDEYIRKQKQEKGG